MFGSGLGGWRLGKLGCKDVYWNFVIIVNHNIEREIHPLIMKICILYYHRDADWNAPSALCIFGVDVLFV
jgi:hypothetical protein